MFVTNDFPSYTNNTVGVECVFNYSIPLGLLDLGAITKLQTCNPYWDFQGISFFIIFSTCSKYTLIHLNNKVN